MSLRFTDGLPVIGYREAEERTLAFAWQWHEPRLRVTFIGHEPALVGHVTRLDGLPRPAPAPSGLAWPGRDDPDRSRVVLDHAIDLWRRKERMFRDCDGRRTGTRRASAPPARRSRRRSRSPGARRPPGRTRPWPTPRRSRPR